MSATEPSTDELTRDDGSPVTEEHLEAVREQARRAAAAIMAGDVGTVDLGLPVKGDQRRRLR